LSVNSIKDILSQKNLCVQCSLAFAFLFGSSVEFRRFAYLDLQFLVLCQKSGVFLLLLSQLMLFIKQFSFQSVLFQFKDISYLLDLLVFDSFEFCSHLLSDLDSLSSGNVGILENVDIWDSLLFKISFKFMWPLLKELVSWFEHLIGLFLAF